MKLLYQWLVNSFQHPEKTCLIKPNIGVSSIPQMNTICPNCNNNITCPDHYVGKPCICPHCQHSFTAIPTVISQTAPNSKKGKEKASEQESALSLATGTANVCIFFAVLTFIGTLITGIRTYPVPEISRIPLAGFGLIILLALLLSMGWLVAASIIKLLVCIVKK